MTSQPLLLSPAGRAMLGARYQTALLENVIPFWLSHGFDAEFGGLMSCLDRDGSVLDTDKSIWAQGRTSWMFSPLYKR